MPIHKPLSPKRYAALLKDLSALLSEADEAAASDKIGAYYQVGERIQSEQLTEKAGYHNSVLRDLSADTHIALRSLQRAVVFVESYPKGVPDCEGLTWTHLRSLLTVRDAKERASYLRLAVQESYSSQELAALLSHAKKGEPEAPTKLERPTESEYLYSGQVTSIIDGDTIDVEVDLGFQTKRTQRLRLANLNTPPVDTPEGREAKRILSGKLLKAGTLVLKTKKIDQHGRYVAHIFYSPQSLSIHECFTNGSYLNAELVRAGVARISK